TCKIAFVTSVFRTSFSRASSVGRINRSIFRRLASRFTSSITESDPYLPVPITRRWHFQGIRSSTETGVCPNASRNFFEGFFLRLRIRPRSITTSCSYVTPSILIAPKLNLPKSITITPSANTITPSANHQPDYVTAERLNRPAAQSLDEGSRALLCLSQSLKNLCVRQ